METVIYKEGELSIAVSKKATKGVVDLLTGIKWGTNGPIYKKLDDEQHIESVRNPHYIMLKKGDKVVGTCTLSQRKVQILGEEYQTYYLRHFAIDKSYQGQQLGKTLLHHVKQYFVSVLEEPFISYAAIEGGNDRSMKVSKFIEYEPIGRVMTQTFSRLFPKNYKQVSIALADEKEWVLDNLYKKYSDHALVQFHKIFYTPEYYLWKEEGEIIAGVQAYRCAWQFESMPGLSGKFIMNVLPYIPIANRIFNPHYRFVAFDGLYCKEGKEAILLKLMETVLAKCNVTSSLLWLGEHSDLYHKLNELNKWGLVDKIQGKVPVTLVVNFHGLPEDLAKKTKSCPMYLAAFDCI